MISNYYSMLFCEPQIMKVTKSIKTLASFHIELVEMYSYSLQERFRQALPDMNDAFEDNLLERGR